MKLLFDQNISYRIIKKISDSFSNCKHVSDCGLNDSEDQEIWLFANTNNYTIVTFDADFYEISLISGIPPKIIWIRTGNITTGMLALMLLEHQNEIVDLIEAVEHKNISCLELE